MRQSVRLGWAGAGFDYACGVPISPLPNFVEPSRYMTADLKGIGGFIKQRSEDFLVEEIPAYDPTGEGEHLYLMVQKAGLSTLGMVALIARHFGVRESAVGYAGLKDKHAITRQAVTVHVPGKKPEDFPQLVHPKLVVLGAVMHANKLRRGHLRGNRFVIKVRGTPATGVITAQKVLTRLEAEGMANRLGEQRFGHGGNNHEIGRSILLGDFDSACDQLIAPAGDIRPEHVLAQEHYFAGRYLDALNLMPVGAETESAVLRTLIRGGSREKAVKSIGRAAASFYATSFQSAIFNKLLEDRLSAGTLATLELGDLAFKHDNTAVFAVDEATLAEPTLAERVAKFEVSPSGPMWGPSMKRATGAVAAREDLALAETGVTLEHLEKFAEQVSEGVAGKRRALRVRVMYPQVEGGVDEFGSYVKCSFELPAGSFATVVMREMIKPAAGAGIEDPHRRFGGVPGGGAAGGGGPEGPVGRGDGGEVDSGE